MFPMAGMVRMYAPNGAEVYLPFDPARAEQLLLQYEAQGLRPLPPAEHEREIRVRIGAFVVRSQINSDRTTTPVVDLYFRQQGGYIDRLRSTRVYLNTPRDVEAFERAFGVSLKSIPVYDADTPLERGKRPERDKRYVQYPRFPVFAVLQLNPQHGKKENAPKYRFLRWERLPVRGGGQKSGNGQSGSGGAGEQKPAPQKPAPKAQKQAPPPPPTNVPPRRAL